MPFASAPWARQDAYARLPFDPTRTAASDLHAGSITFLDLAQSGRQVGTIAGYLDAVPAWLLARPTAVLIRWLEDEEVATPEEAAALFRQRLEARGISVAVGLIRFPIASEPDIVWDRATTARNNELGFSQDLEFMNRARRVEIASYLHWGGAVWRPSGYHYRLPSGRHSRTYVRLADTFTDIRAAATIACWLHRHLKNDGSTAIIVDTGTLGPVVTELRAAAERAGGSVAPVIGIDSYPPSPLGLQQRLKKLTDGLPAVGLVSVSDTGRLATQLANVLSHASSGAVEVIVEQFVARGLAEATALEPGVTGVLDPWISLGNPGGDPAEPPCEACRDPAVARLVQVDPRSMSAMVLPEPALLMPDLTDARRNSSLWEAYYTRELNPDSGAWLSFTGPTGTRRILEGTAESDNTGTFFEPAELLRKGTHIRDRARSLADIPARRANDPEALRILATREAVGDGARIVIIDDVERGLFRKESEWNALKTELSPFVAREATYFRFSASQKPSSLEKVDGADEPHNPSNVLVVALGLRTGVTLHRMFLAARERWPQAQYRGLVVHAHPHDDRIWASARNTFKDHTGTSRLLALWLTFVPRGSPFAAELELLGAIPESSLPGSVRGAFAERCAALETPLGLVEPFWGPSRTLRSGSYFGESLDAAATAAAIGAALQSARLRSRPKGSPHWAMIDLPRTFRSFFDGLIHVSVLRWCQPEECWWGERPGECIQLVREMQNQMEQDWPLILPELVLASLQGKLPKEDSQEVLALARQALVSSEAVNGIADDRARSFLALGLELHRVANT